MKSKKKKFVVRRFEYVSLIIEVKAIDEQDALEKAQNIDCDKWDYNDNTDGANEPEYTLKEVEQ